MLSREVEHSASVDNVIVGTRARGTSHTKGDLAFHLVENRNDDFLVVKFQGRTQSRTVGTSGPVTIQSRSETRFLCTNRIRFDPLQGLVAGPTEITSTTTLVYESIQPTRRGIGSRLVGRVAQRRAADSHAQATQEIAQDQRAKLIREFDSRLHAQLASLNRRTQMIRYAGGMWRSSGPVPFAAIVTPDGLQLGLGVPRTLSPSSQIPPITGNSPAAEIWIHGSVFSDLLSPLASFARQRSDWNSTTSRSVPAAVENVWIRVALGSSGEWPQITGGTSSDGYTFVSNLLSKIPLDIPDVSSQSMVPPSGSDAQVVDLTWLLGLLIADNSK